MPKLRTLSLAKTDKKRQSRIQEQKNSAKPRAQLMRGGLLALRSLSSFLTVRESVNNNASQPVDSPQSPMAQSQDCNLLTLVEPVKKRE